MSAADDILANLPLEALARQVGADPSEVEQAVRAAVPALVGGLHANAQDAAGASSILDALSQHDGGLADGLDPQALNRIDTGEGEKIAQHIFGANTGAVVNQLGGLGGGGGAGGSALVQKLIPLLAPIVMSYVVKQMSARGGAPQTAGGSGALNDVLEQVLKGATGGSGGSGSGSGGLGSILGDVLGGLLGGGRRK